MDSAYARWAARWRVPLGFALGIAYLVFSRPTEKLLLAGGLVAAVGVALRGYAAGHLRKNQALAISGPYAWTRNPLYVGSSIIGIGFALAGGNVWLALGFVFFFLVVYWPVIRREEDFLRREFGAAYEDYARRVPAFFPRWPREGGDNRFLFSQYRKNHEYEALLGYVVLLIILAFKLRLR